MYDDDKNDINNVFNEDSSDDICASEDALKEIRDEEDFTDEDEITATEESAQEQTDEKEDDNPLNIPDDEIWTYRVPGLAAPRIGKPIKNKLLKQIIFVVIIVAAIGLSMYFSFNAVSREPFEYKTRDDGGYLLQQFNNPGDILELTVNHYCNMEIDEETGAHMVVEDETKVVTAIREYAFNCDSYIQKINIGKDVKEIDGKSFYYCTALYAVEVDPENQYFTSVDGVLYNKDKTKIICYPPRHDIYLRMKNGYLADASAELNSLYLRAKNYTVPAWDSADYPQYRKDVLTYVIPSSVKEVGQLAFAYASLVEVYLPEGLETIGSLGFFKVNNEYSSDNQIVYLDTINSYTGEYADTALTDVALLGTVYPSLPEGLKDIGSDAFSYNQSLSYMYIPASIEHIGHHAFWDCVYKQGGELKAISVMNVALSEEEFKKIEKGDRWLPKYKYMLFNKNIDVNYGAVRQGA